MNTFRGKAAIFTSVRAGVKVIRPGRVMAAMASLLLCAALLTACADDKSADNPDRDGTFDVLLPHKAGSGSFEKLAGGAHRLTLHNIAAKTNYSAEQMQAVFSCKTVWIKMVFMFIHSSD